MTYRSAEREAASLAHSAWQRQRVAPTVFVVDDDQHIREVIEQTLVEEGYHVVPLADGGQALSAVTQAKPALVLLDLMMPNVSGWDVLEQLRSQPSTATLPVVVISASRDLEATYTHIGADGCLPKPFDLDELITTVQNYAGTPDSNGSATA